MERLVIVPDEKFEALVLSLKSRLPPIVDEVRAENLASLMGERSRRVLLGIADAGQGQELLLWARSDRAYVVAWTSLPPESEVVGTATADPVAGLINRLFASGRSDVESREDLQATTWTNLQEKRGRALHSMAASPVILFGKCAAAVSLAQYQTEQIVKTLDQSDVVRVAEVASLLARLLEDRLLRAALGIESL
jgi:hypothetical protein